MRPGPALLIKATLIGCFLLSIFGYAVSVGAAAQGAASSQPKPTQAPVATAQAQSKPANDSQQQQANNQSANQSSGGCEISSNFPNSILQWCELITKYAHQRDLSPNLIASVMLQESGGNPKAYSASGAVGLLQVMPSNGLAAGFQCASGPCFANRPTITQLEDPEFNIQYATGMLENLLAKYGNIRDALAAYGPMNVGYYYADKVLSIYNNLGK
jgi:soluble lytic murein transglycosylase-like protein